MKIGILGTGKIVEDLLQARDRLPFDYAALLSTPRSEAKAKEMCVRYRLDGYYLNYEELLAGEAEVIYIALPNHLHWEYARKALLHDKHVIVEKPAVVTLEQMKDLAALAEERGRMLAEAVTVHYLPAFRVLRQRLEKIGEIKIVSFNYSQYSSRYDAFRQGQIPPAFDPKCAGGALMDINVYNVNALVGLFGRPKGVRYEANWERGIDTSGILTLDYGSFRACAVGAKDCQAPSHSTIQGTGGCLVISAPVNGMNSFDLFLNDGTEEHWQGPDGEHRMVYEFQEFQRMIETGDWKKERGMLDISIAVAEILDAVRRR